MIKSLSNLNNDKNAIRSVLYETRLVIMELQYIEDELIVFE